MNADLNMKVNVLPVYTYNFLHVNDSTINTSDIKIDNFSTPSANSLPNGVELKKDVSFEEAGSIFRENKDRRHFARRHFRSFCGYLGRSYWFYRPNKHSHLCSRLWAHLVCFHDRFASRAWLLRELWYRRHQAQCTCHSWHYSQYRCHAGLLFYFL